MIFAPLMELFTGALAFLWRHGTPVLGVLFNPFTVRRR